MNAKKMVKWLKSCVKILPNITLTNAQDVSIDANFVERLESTNT